MNHTKIENTWREHHRGGAESSCGERRANDANENVTAEE